MAINTAMNVDIRRNFTILGYRNYEPGVSGVVYKSNREGLEYAGTTYDTGVTITKDGSGATSFKNDALMERYFNEGLIYPTS